MPRGMLQGAASRAKPYSPRPPALQVGFGEAGAEVIADNMRSGGDLNPMVPGRKVAAIFGFCDIRSFTGGARAAPRSFGSLSVFRGGQERAERCA